MLSYVFRNAIIKEVLCSFCQIAVKKHLDEIWHMRNAEENDSMEV